MENLEKLNHEIRTLMINGNYKTAEEVIMRSLESNPGNAAAWANLSVIKQAQSNNIGAAECLKRALEIDPKLENAYINLALIEASLGNTEKAKQIIKIGEANCGSNALFLLILGNILKESKDHEAALSSYNNAIELDKQLVEAYFNKAILLEEMGRLQTAEDQYKKILLIDRRNIDACIRLSKLFSRNGRQEEATKLLYRRSKLEDVNTEELNILGEVLFEQREYEYSLEVYEKLVDSRGHAEDAYHAALCNEKLGMQLNAKERYYEALSKYNCHLPSQVNLGNLLVEMGEEDRGYELLTAAHKASPENPNVSFSLANYYYKRNEYEECYPLYEYCMDYEEFRKWSCLRLGNIRSKQGSFKDALIFYNKAIEHDDKFQEALFNLGISWHNLGNHKKAIAFFERLRDINPYALDVNLQLGHQYYLEQLHVDAISAYKEELRLNPDNLQARLHLDFCKRQQCKWDDYSSSMAWIERISRMPDTIVPPWNCLSLTDDPEVELRLARLYARNNNYKLSENYKTNKNPRRKGKVHIGFYSSDFYGHATMFLIEDLFSKLNRDLFRLFLYDYSEVSDDITERLAKDRVEYFGLHNLDDNEVQELSQMHELDIAIDLKGYTAGARTMLFTRRLAPIHISFLGYPGTSGSNMYDYILADNIVIPKTHEQYYSEEILRMPLCYQPNIKCRSIDHSYGTRTSNFLPADIFVFCCFNANYKISPIEFEVWMDILRNTDSVLWLLSSTEDAENNLRQEAKIRDIDPDRLYFSGKLPVAQHLGRHRCADLQLDTFNVSAHTTAADSLYSGLPILTKIGNTFSSRVCASILRAVNLQELITYSADEYKEKAIYLATHPDEIQRIKSTLISDQNNLPLFDSTQYALDFEKLMDSLFK